MGDQDQDRCVRAYSSGDEDEDKEERARLTLISSGERTSRECDSGTGRCEEVHSLVCNAFPLSYSVGARAAMLSSCRSIRRSPAKTAWEPPMQAYLYLCFKTEG